eukprot:782341-Pelagomonas_calceolata.AAC.1
MHRGSCTRSRFLGKNSLALLQRWSGITGIVIPTEAEVAIIECHLRATRAGLLPQSCIKSALLQWHDTKAVAVLQAFLLATAIFLATATSHKAPDSPSEMQFAA